MCPGRLRHNGAVSTPRDEPRLIADRYRLHTVLGSGSMGAVWSAYDEFLHRPVAVKEVRLPLGLPGTQADELRERTLREARAIAVLSHPNVITLHDVVREGQEPFVVMELLPSRSLAALLRYHGWLAPAQAAVIGDAVASALEAAHAAGITHRDVKPGNVLVAEDGQIKLTDFGIARNVSEATMTRTGVLLGSPAYVAPEVASGQGVTQAADLWGLGATLFATVEGAPPYDADGDPLETVGQVVHGSVPQPRPSPLAPVIAGLMRKSPPERMPAAEVRRRLHPYLVAERGTVFPPALFRIPNATDNAPRAAEQLTEVIAAEPTPHQDTEPVGTPGRDAEPAPPVGELAAEPGPLPFALRDRGGDHAATAPSAPASRGPLAWTMLVALAVVLFVAAVGGGFALARTIGGAPITPPESEPSPTSATASAQPLVSRSGDATNLKGAKGGLFSVKVPENWTKFVTQQPSGALPASTLVQFVSGSGTQVLNVAHYPRFYAGHSLDEYRQMLRKQWGSDKFVLVDSVPLQDEDGIMMTYRTTEQGEDSAGNSAEPTPRMSRATFAKLFRSGSSLWEVSVTVPTEQEGAARSELFDRIVPTFTTTG